MEKYKTLVREKRRLEAELAEAELEVKWCKDEIARVDSELKEQ